MKNKLTKITVAMLLALSVSAVSADRLTKDLNVEGKTSIYQYDNFTTALDGNVGIASSNEYRGISLSRRPTVFAALQLTGIEGSLDNFYIGMAGTSIDQYQKSFKFVPYIGYDWSQYEDAGFNVGLGLRGTFFSNQDSDFHYYYDTDTKNIDYGEVYGNVSYTWDNEYKPQFGLNIDYTPDYYNYLGSTVYYNLNTSFIIPTDDRDWKLYANAGYSDISDDEFVNDYWDFRVGVTTMLGLAKVDLSGSWIDSSGDNEYGFSNTPFGHVSGSDNAKASLTVSYNF